MFGRDRSHCASSATEGRAGAETSRSRAARAASCAAAAASSGRREIASACSSASGAGAGGSGITIRSASSRASPASTWSSERSCEKASRRRVCARTTTTWAEARRDCAARTSAFTAMPASSSAWVSDCSRSARCSLADAASRVASARTASQYASRPASARSAATWRRAASLPSSSCRLASRPASTAPPAYSTWRACSAAEYAVSMFGYEHDRRLQRPFDVGPRNSGTALRCDTLATAASEG